MNRDDIRRIAKEAGLAGAKLSAGLEEMRLDMWERFAELVAAFNPRKAEIENGRHLREVLPLQEQALAQRAKRERARQIRDEKSYLSALRRSQLLQAG